ncbi:MAG: 3-deoxy-manno-octulosonate cytidylyltransferase [Pseudomonadota bacterium]|nr:3-deoxy-manno-octulosonate cytidylyltransferase [Pseudomonadota bacterium]
MSRSVCVIPARMGSSRFPGKPLEPLLGLALILHIYERCRLYEGFERVVVATCDNIIHQAILAHGGESVMTADTHERCTDRVEEAITNLDLGLTDDNFVLMVQGDEVLVSPDMLKEMTETYWRDRPQVVNLTSRMYRLEDHNDPNTVKVVSDPSGRALYFSRAPIPSRARTGTVPMYQQTGIIGFSPAFLHKFSALEPTPLETIESVDMMRVIEHGLRIQVVKTDIETVGVDTPSDLKRAEEILRNDPYTAVYMENA